MRFELAFPSIYDNFYKIIPNKQINQKLFDNKDNYIILQARIMGLSPVQFLLFIRENYKGIIFINANNKLEYKISNELLAKEWLKRLNERLDAFKDIIEILNEETY